MSDFLDWSGWIITTGICVAGICGVVFIIAQSCERSDEKNAALRAECIKNGGSIISDGNNSLSSGFHCIRIKP